jgi:hypothetical protein
MNAWKNWGAHALAYILSCLSIVQTLSPALLGPYGPAIVGVSGILLTAIHNTQTAIANGNAPLPPPAIRSLLLPIGLLVLSAGACVGLSGCATAPTTTQQAGISVAVDIATGAAIQQQSSDSAEWKARAVSFKAIAVTLKQVNDAGTATLATLAADLAPLIAKLPATDQLAAHTVVAALTPYLNQEIQGNPKLQNAQATVDVVLQAVIDACAGYGA